MTEIPGHTSPPYSEEAREDALFHYTTAIGLIGVLESAELWSTAYFCTNDESELATGKGILAPLFRVATYDMIGANDPLVHTFRGRGVDIRHYADEVLQHRVLLNYDGQAENVRIPDLIGECLQSLDEEKKIWT